MLYFEGERLAINDIEDHGHRIALPDRELNADEVGQSLKDEPGLGSVMENKDPLDEDWVEVHLLHHFLEVGNEDSIVSLLEVKR